IAAPGWFWTFFNPGVPAVLSVLFRLFPSDPDAVARTATAVATGAVCVVPFLAWREVFSFRVRIVAGFLLAAWPGQVLFSPVVAQDNWVLLPVVGLAVLAVRVASVPAKEAPFLAAVLWVACVAVRQEMLVVALPLAAASAGLWPGRRVRWDATLRFVAASVLLLSCLGLLRARATGHFSVSTGHGGKAMLGSWVPGSVANGWVDPLPFVASIEPDLLRDERQLNRGAVRLAVGEAVHRPGFHLIRLLGQLTQSLRSGESVSLYWSLWCDGVLPASHPSPAGSAARISHLLDAWEGALHVFFVAVGVFALLHRERALLVLLAPIVLKVFLHLGVGMQGRYFLPVTALEILAVSVGLGIPLGLRDWRRFAVVLAATGVVLAAFAAGGKRAFQAATAQDTDVPRSYRFALNAIGGRSSLDCSLEHGRLQELNPDGGVMRLENPDPVPGEESVLECRAVREDGGGRMVAFEAMDTFAPGGMLGRVIQAASISGRDVLVHDIAAEPGTGWNSVTLPAPGATPVILRFVLRAD
ncbi:MAG TPA: hypothetical protein VHM71_02520, partial [Candidatus Deferrimicrobium sp.]|nr:hypothetical protein [Candidatus Deferrimicrobium sp.]